VRIWSSWIITTEQNSAAHKHYCNFLHLFESTYGSAAVTPNMHLSLHIAAMVTRFGPPTGFWLFSFERYNGIIGKMHTNNRTVERTFLRTFVDFSSLVDISSRSLFEFNDAEKVCQSWFLVHTVGSGRRGSSRYLAVLRCD
jgi:hypothetical protein